jgi:A/G-specific adenine glycosylase
LARDAINQYPGRKPKREKPVRKARIFVAHDGNGACLVEQRPADGIWGGLWTPPERPADTSTEGFVREFGLQAPEQSHTAPSFRHTFTHFHLDIEPVYIEVAEPAQAVRERDDVRWYAPGSNEPLGLSAPAVKLIASLTEFSLT